MWLIFTGTLIHLMFLTSIFDIYFTTPIIHGMTPFSSDKEPPAKRLVLIVSDGLRAETLYGSYYTSLKDMENKTPFLSSIVQSKGCWGTSHTRVPTESRPGHVAIVAGIYEDPSAVAKGWKENPVDFDTVFNESRFTWSWGSPDILPMFTKVSGNHVHAYSYNSEEEDFSGKESTALLDKWVFDHFKQFLSSSRERKQLGNKIRSDKVIFFLHLLGMDTAGHTHKPYSPEHIYNLKVVDEGVKHVNYLMNTFYQDNGTAFLFTADHGMTNWGSHGAGSEFETETPFIAWGAGIKHNVAPIQIKQADIAPLIATLIGIPIPINSVGTLPTELLLMSEDKMASAIYANARQICEQFKTKQHRTRKNSFRIWFSEYPDLKEEGLKTFEDLIELSIRRKDYNTTMKLCHELIKLSLLGLDYYQNYYQRLLLTCIAVSYIGWIVLLLLSLAEEPSIEWYDELLQSEIYSNNRYGNMKVHFRFAVCLLLTCCSLYFQSLPNMYYIYCTAPQFILWSIYHKLHHGYKRLHRAIYTRDSLIQILLCFAFYFIGVEIMVWSFFNRAILSVPLCILALWSWSKPNIAVGIKLWWSVSCLLLAVFPLLPVVGTSFDMSLITGGVFIWLIFALISCILFKRDKRHKDLTTVQIIIMLICVCNLKFIDNSFAAKQGLTRLNQIVTWFLLVISLILPLFGSNRILPRVINIMLSYIVPFISLSVSHEPMFLLILILNLIAWFNIEVKSGSSYAQLYVRHFGHLIRTADAPRNINVSDFRRAYFFLLYAILAFFGLGNIASLNSFDPMWVRSFVTIFSPFTMTGLILFKILVPYLAVSSVFRSITLNIGVSVRHIFTIVLIYCDIAGAHFLFLVQNTGSWLDIGSSISHFVIMQIIVLFLMILYVVSSIMLGFNSDVLYRIFIINTNLSNFEFKNTI